MLEQLAEVRTILFLSPFSSHSHPSQIKVGNPEDPTVLVNAVIHEQSADKAARFIALAKSTQTEILHGGKVDKSVGWFVDPTVLVTKDPNSKLLQEEMFAPILTVYVYPDNQVRREVVKKSEMEQKVKGSFVLC
jgi:acyl-CoA reductase-like NAD-dependent aldehyde dehydrogenase